jgi:phage baseplate assembly protein W
MTTPLPKTYAEARWLDDLDPSGAETDSDLESLEQDVLHILSEALGSNIADPKSGVDAPSYLNGTLTRLRTMPGIIDAQLANVTRITSSKTTLTQQDDGSYQIAVQVAVGAQVVGLNYLLGPGGVTRG